MRHLILILINSFLFCQNLTLSRTHTGCDNKKRRKRVFFFSFCYIYLLVDFDGCFLHSNSFVCLYLCLSLFLCLLSFCCSTLLSSLCRSVSLSLCLSVVLSICLCLFLRLWMYIFVWHCFSVLRMSVFWFRLMYLCLFCLLLN
jgi:hypothetical protein